MTIFAEIYRPAIKLAILQQLAILVLSSLVLDGGVAPRVALTVILGHWAIILLILVARPGSPTGLDLILIKYGTWVALVLVALISGLYGQWRS